MLSFQNLKASANKYECIYETSGTEDTIKKMNFMLDRTAEVELDFEKKELLDYPYKTIAIQTERSIDKAYGIMWESQQVRWMIYLEADSIKKQRKLYTFKLNRFDAELRETGFFNEEKTLTHFYNCNQSNF